MSLQTQEDGGVLPRHPLSFIPGCNTPPEISRAQLALNIKRDLPWLEVVPAHDKALVLVAGGPSLKRRWPEILTHENADILAMNNTYSFLQERGIVPDYYMMLDARRENVDFLKNPHPKTKHYIAGLCHPDIFDALQGFDTTLYLTSLPDTKEVAGGEGKKMVQLSGPVGMVGMKALSLAFALGYRELYLYGYDSSYEDAQHHAYAQPLNDQSGTIEVFLGDKRYVTTPALAHQATEFSGFAKELVMFHKFDINLRCEGLLPDMVAHCNAVGEIPLEERERQKYQEIWTHDAYRRESPSEKMVTEAIDALGMKPGHSVIDFGCGSGRASAKLKDLGFAVTSVDFVDNSVDPGLTLNFVKACLWDLPEMQADWGYCTDVMDHIPIEMVADVLGGIASCSTHGAFFNISTQRDNLGVKIGRKLHMTVMTAEGWLKLLNAYWPQVEMRKYGDEEATFICRRITN